MSPYYSLSASSVVRESAASRLAHGMPDRIPTTLLGRFAVDHDHQKQGIGGDMLLDALTRAARAAEGVGSRAVELHAIDDAAKVFYMSHGFKEIDPAVNPYDLYLLMKDVLRTLRDQGAY